MKRLIATARRRHRLCRRRWNGCQPDHRKTAAQRGRHVVQTDPVRAATRAGGQIRRAGQIHHRRKRPDRGRLLVETGFQGVSYNQMLPPGTPATGVTLSVFDSTKDAGAAQVSQHIIILEPAAEQLGVTETYFFKNEGKVTYNDPESGTLRFFVAEASKRNRKSSGDLAGQHGGPARARSRQNSGRLQAGLPDQARRRDAHRHQLYPACGGNLLEQSLLQRCSYRAWWFRTESRSKGTGSLLLAASRKRRRRIYETRAAAFEVKIAGTGSVRSP